MPVDLTIKELKEMGFRPVSELGKPETPLQKKRRIKFINDALLRAGQMHITQPCTLCKTEFTVQGKHRLNHCRKCILRLIKENVWEKNEDSRVVRNF